MGHAVTQPIPETVLERKWPAVADMKLPAVSFLVNLRYVRALITERFRTPIGEPFPSEWKNDWRYPFGILLAYFPIAWWFSLFAAGFFLIQYHKNLHHGSLLLIFSCWLLAMGCVTATSKYQLGARHYLPLYPLSIVFLSVGLSDVLPNQHRRRVLLVLGTLIFPSTISFLITGNPIDFWLRLM